MVTSSRIIWGDTPAVIGYEESPAFGYNEQVAIPSVRVAIGEETIEGYRTPQGSHTIDASMMDTREMRRSIQREYQRRYDNGHDMTLNRTRNTGTSVSFVSTAPWGVTYGYSGTAYISSYVGDTPPLGAPSQNDQFRAGSRAFRELAPTKPEASLAQFIGELREGLPRLLGDQLQRNGGSLQSIGGEHLNLQFGAKPLVSDLKSMAEAVLTANKRLSQLRQDSGGIVRRRMTLGQDSSSETTQWDDTLGLVGTSYPETYLNDRRVRVTATNTVSSDMWFSGAFSYHLAESIGFAGRMEAYNQQAEALLGASLDADDVWELTPWSWLVDYFADVGGFLSNATTFAGDNVVARYGYVMCHSQATRHIVVGGARGRDNAFIGSPSGGLFSVTKFTERKTRLGSTPYGFGYDMENLSPERWAILGALGMTKTNR